MNNLIEETISEVKAKYPNLSKTEIERIIDSQFEMVVDNMRNRSLRVVKLIHLGKIKPSNWFINNHDKFSKKV